MGQLEVVEDKRTIKFQQHFFGLSRNHFYLVGGLEPWNFMIFPSYWECHHPNWRTHILQRGRYTTNQLCHFSSYHFLISNFIPEIGPLEMMQKVHIPMNQLPGTELNNCFGSNPRYGVCGCLCPSSEISNSNEHDYTILHDYCWLMFMNVDVHLIESNPKISMENHRFCSIPNWMCISGIVHGEVWLFNSSPWKDPPIFKR